jgi:uncharacterized membrane protein SpoIIM required for sporulation
MDAGQYKDYVLVFLFVQNKSDKYGGIPETTGHSRHQRQADIGFQFSQKIIRLYVAANLLTISHELVLCIKIALFYSYNGFIAGHHGTCR